MSTSTPTSPDTDTRTRSTTNVLLRRGVAAIALGLILTILTRLVAVAFDASLADVGQFGWVPVVAVTVVAAIGATVVYALLDRFTARPERWFLVAAVVVFLFMLLPLTVGAESVGIESGAQLGLGALHLAAAVGIVAGVLGGDRVTR